MKKQIQITMVLFLLLSTLMSNYVTAHAVEPRYAGIYRISSTLSISESGAASCSGHVVLWSGNTADLTVELKKDGTTIKTWTDSGSGTVDAGGTYYVTSGHDYVVTTTATVYSSSGQWLESPSKDSIGTFY